MTLIITANYKEDTKATNAFDELVSKGFPRDKLFFDKEESQIKVTVPETSRPGVEEILRRHEPEEVWSRPIE